MRPDVERVRERLAKKRGPAVAASELDEHPSTSAVILEDRIDGDCACTADCDQG